MDFLISKTSSWEIVQWSCSSSDTGVTKQLRGKTKLSSALLFLQFWWRPCIDKYFESQPCRINIFTLACSFPTCCLSAFNNYLDHSLVVVCAGVQSAAQMPGLSIWAVSKALNSLFGLSPSVHTLTEEVSVSPVSWLDVLREWSVRFITSQLTERHISSLLLEGDLLRWISWKLSRNVWSYFTSQTCILWNPTTVCRILFFTILSIIFSDQKLSLYMI